MNENYEVMVTTWEDFHDNGTVIIQRILEEIDKCDLFMCDLTDLNLNVLYELGYAIAKGKKVWITLNSTHPQATQKYREFKLLKTRLYTEYQNSQELIDKFFSEIPYEQTSTPNIELPEPSLTKYLLYLKCAAGSSASSNLTNLVKNKTNLPSKIDDPIEVIESLNWYLELLPNSFGVIIHFHKEESTQETYYELAKKSLIAGIAKGLKINTLLLAHYPFNAVLDYYDEVKVHKTAHDCEVIAKQWLSPIVEQYKKMDEAHLEYKSDRKAVSKLNSLRIGDYTAENETQELTEYFLETAEYNDALSSQQVLFVGRKGTGKTANLVKLRDTMSRDRRNFVVSIQPQGHEFEGVLDIMEKLRYSSEQGNFIESIWKFLIYTEIARQYNQFLDSQPPHIPKTEAETEFREFVEQNKRVINADFTLRLENAVGELKEINPSDTMEQQRKRISEFLHTSMLSGLRKHLGEALRKKEIVKILIDNLDKGWNDGANLESLSELLLGLLSVVHSITAEFQRNTYRHTPVNMSLIVFLRSDIFSRIMSHAPERDKITTKHLSWSDPDLLFQVIEKRVQYSSNGITSPEMFWKEFFCENVNGIPLRQYIENLIIPRPRDIIFIFQKALQKAINKQHTLVTEEDFLAAESDYSYYAFLSVLPENGKRIKDLESVFYEFVGQFDTLNHDELIDLLKNTQEDPNEIIQILCETTFLGQEISQNNFEYYSDKRPSQIINKLAVMYSKRQGMSQRYRINPAFHNYLGIEKNPF